MSRYEEWNRYLPGLTEAMPEAFCKLAEILKYQVFELCEEQEFLIPYMMSDAVEDYLILKNCRLTGAYLPEKRTETEAYLTKNQEGYVLSIRQGSENAFTLSFDALEEKTECYQYHRIGHFWVRGQEQWRQLVYMIGTIYEKYIYLGGRFCNEIEKEVMHLVEFAPFRMWSPIHESLEEKYPATYDGIDCMKELAAEAGDVEFLRWIKVYERFPVKLLERMLGKRLLSKNRQQLYEVIWEKVRAGSESYPERSYGESLDREIVKKRAEVHRSMLEQGFSGDYPEYEKDGAAVIAMEEHPFTKMEFDHFDFQIQLMVSESRQGKHLGRNGGFFRGRNRKGYILNTNL